jgi:hypothetical protein
MPEIIKNVDEQLLCSHLTDSMIPGTGKADLTGLGGAEEGAVDEPGEEIPNYPRSMLRFELGDGSVKFEAMEYRSIPEIQLGVTKLGYKARLPRLARSVVPRLTLLVDALEGRVLPSRRRFLGTENDS